MLDVSAPELLTTEDFVGDKNTMQSLRPSTKEIKFVATVELPGPEIKSDNGTPTSAPANWSYAVITSDAPIVPSEPLVIDAEKGVLTTVNTLAIDVLPQFVPDGKWLIHQIYFDLLLITVL